MSDRAELGSEAWLGIARNFLELRLSDAGSQLDDVRFAICETLTNPPAHLCPEGSDRITWHFVFDGAKVLVGFGRIDDADLQSESDYATMLPLARTVYSEHPEILAKQREQRPSDGPALPAPLAPILLATHDHLARHTL